MSATLAKPCGDCCFRSIPHSGSAKGQFGNLGGVPTYIARPDGEEESKRIILFFSDVYGCAYINSKLAMDYWAENGMSLLALRAKR